MQFIHANREIKLFWGVDDFKWNSLQENKLLHDAVTASDIAAIVSRATGIPVHDMLKGERQKLLHLEGKE